MDYQLAVHHQTVIHTFLSANNENDYPTLFVALLFITIYVYFTIVLVFDSGMPRRNSFINRNDSVDSTTACSLGNQSLSNAAVLGGASNFLGVPKSDSPGLLAVPTGHCGELI
jgi:hypothetical protein